MHNLTTEDAAGARHAALKAERDRLSNALNLLDARLFDLEQTYGHMGAQSLPETKAIRARIDDLTGQLIAVTRR